MVVVCIEAVAVGAPMEADGGGGGTLLFELGDRRRSATNAVSENEEGFLLNKQDE